MIHATAPNRQARITSTIVLLVIADAGRRLGPIRLWRRPKLMEHPHRDESKREDSGHNNIKSGDRSFVAVVASLQAMNALVVQA